MWDNLLSGAIGSIIAVIGAVVVAVLTVRKTSRDQADHAERARQIQTAGTLASHLVALYDELKAIDLRSGEPIPADLDRLRPLADDFRRSVVVDGPLLPDDVEARMKEARKEVVALVTVRDGPMTRVEVVRGRKALRAAGDVLREFRRPRAGDARPNPSRSRA